MGFPSRTRSNATDMARYFVKVVPTVVVGGHWGGIVVIYVVGDLEEEEVRDSAPPIDGRSPPFHVPARSILMCQNPCRVCAKD